MQPETPNASFEKRKRELFEAVLNLPKAGREAFLAKATYTDAGLGEAVRRLLVSSREESDGVLNRPVVKRELKLSELTPASIGKYLVIRHLGTGGMGSAYLCIAPGMSAQVAVKIIRSDLQTSIVRANFARERDVLTCLQHPNVCRLLDADVAAGGVPFIVMEYVEGESLSAFCSRTGCPLKTRLLLFSQVLAGVEYFHSRSVVHRDLKPSNLFVASGKVKILDFGLAKMINHQKGLTGHGPTNTAHRFMTIPYASPEQLSGTLSGRASDIYTLGLICYELLTGRKPYPRESETTAQLRLASLSASNPVPPSRILDELPGSVDNLIANAMQFNPDHRYASAVAFLSDLGRCLEGSKVQLRHPGSTMRAGR